MFERIRSAIDVDRLQRSHVAVIGSAPTLTTNLVRCGLGSATLVDPQDVELPNVARQDYLATAVGRPKVEALADHIRSVSPAADLTCLRADFCGFSDDQVDALFGHTDLLVFATDSFAAQARGNEVALRLQKPALWVGLYAGGRAGELIWWTPEVAPCFRCLLGKRYQAHEQARRDGRSLDPPSTGATIFDIQLLDSIAGHLALGLLTRGSANRFGGLLDHLAGDNGSTKNFLQVKIDPSYTWNGRDVIREQLGIPEGRPAYVSWVTIARADPDRGEPPCPDCVRFRGRLPQPVSAVA